MILKDVTPIVDRIQQELGEINSEAYKDGLEWGLTLIQIAPTIADNNGPVENNLNFGQAIEALKSGKKVSRAGWNGKGMWIVLMPALYLPPYNTADTNRKVNDRTAKHIGIDRPLDSQPYFAMWTAQSKWQPGWLASQADMLAEDWCIVH